MTSRTLDSPIKPPSDPSVNASVPSPATPDLDTFRQDLTELDLTDEQAKELLQTLWHIMSMFVDIGWGVDSVQQLLPDLYKNLAPDSRELLDSKGDADDAAIKEGPTE